MSALDVEPLRINMELPMHLDSAKKKESDMIEIEQQINLVVDAREEAQRATNRRIEIYQEWFEEYKTFFDTEMVAKTALSEAEAKLRELALQSYAENKAKTVAPGVGIRIMTRLVYDAKEAMDWALKHSLALALDKPKFEKIAKVTPLSFVVSIEEPIATIAAELAKIIKEE